RLADLALLHPAAGLALYPAPCRHAIGRGKAWVELDRAVEEFQRLLVARPRPWVNGGVRPQITIVGVEALGRLAADALDLRALELRRDGADHALGHLVLELENILERPVEPIRPDVRSGSRIDELRGDAYPVRRLAHAAFEHIADAELATDLLHVHGMTFVGEARVAGDHEQVAKAR